MEYDDRTGLGGPQEELSWAANRLKRDGYLVLPVFGPAQVAQKRRELNEALRGFTEYTGLSATPLDDNVPLVNGGFGALGNPSSFHCKFTREMRRIAHETVLHHRAIPVPYGCYLSQVFDRLMVRKSPQVASSESWHRDRAVRPLGAKEALYGGWIALDDQIFSGIPRTHLKTNPGGGFSALSDADRKIIAAHPKSPIPVPAGHMLIFNETMIHEVVGKKHSDTQARLFTAFFVSTGPEPLLPIDGIIAEQAVAPLKSGQQSPVTPVMYINQYRVNEARNNAMVAILKEAATSPHTIGASARYKAGVQVRLAGHRKVRGTRVMDSLAAMHARDESIALYAPYTEADLAILTPERYPYAYAE